MEPENQNNMNVDNNSIQNNVSGIEEPKVNDSLNSEINNVEVNQPQPQPVNNLSQPINNVGETLNTETIINEPTVSEVVTEPVNNLNQNINNVVNTNPVNQEQPVVNNFTEQQPQINPTMPINEPQVQVPTNNKKGSNKALIVIIIVLLIALAAGAFYIFKLKDSSANNRNQSTDIIDENNDNTATQNQEEQKNPTTGGEITADWTKYNFSVNDKTLALPVKYADLSSASGFVINSVYQNTTIPKNHYTLVNLYKNNKLALYTEITNTTDTDVLYTDGLVTRVSQTKYQVDQVSTTLTFPGELTVGMEMTKEKVQAILGEPSDVDNYSSDGYVKDTITYNGLADFSTINYYQIDIVNGIIDTLTLDHRSY